MFRSHIQHQAGVSYVFCGSGPSLLRALFEDRSRPLYGQAQQLRLGHVTFEAAHDFIAARIAERTGRQALVILDEFQALIDLPGVDAPGSLGPARAAERPRPSWSTCRIFIHNGSCCSRTSCGSRCATSRPPSRISGWPTTPR